MVRPVYRTRQVWLALRPRIEHDDLLVAMELLAPAQAALFRAMERRDQRHALEVMRRLSDEGVRDRDLLVAALLHDCGKGAVPIWLRIVKVLSPGTLANVARPTGSSWRTAAYRLLHHAELGAVQAEAAGVSALTASLIRGHVEPAHQPQLALLMAADDAS